MVAAQKTRKKELSEQERHERDDAYNEFKAKALTEPLDWFKHDTNARVDEKVRYMIAERGLEWYGLWWVLVELLYQQKGHIYDVSTDIGWRMLALDISSCGIFFDIDKTKEAMNVFVHYGLLDKVSFNEFSHVTNARVLDIVDEIASGKATLQIKGWLAHQGKDETETS